jgi:hypothetical protein
MTMRVCRLTDGKESDAPARPLLEFALPKASAKLGLQGNFIASGGPGGLSDAGGRRPYQ